MNCNVIFDIGKGGVNCNIIDYYAKESNYIFSYCLKESFDRKKRTESIVSSMNR